MSENCRHLKNHDAAGRVDHRYQLGHCTDQYTFVIAENVPSTEIELSVAGAAGKSQRS